ncbi:MAG: hypothetical protein M5U14_16645 [Acidimicrobiia bacterium]|nr:hypothetical protein [Acidimicrobiia bacterium]
MPRHRLFATAFDVGDFCFMPRQMLGIKARAERRLPSARAGPAAPPTPRR